MVTASSVVIIFFLESLTASFIFAYLRLIYANYLFMRFQNLNAWIVFCRCISSKIYRFLSNNSYRFALRYTWIVEENLT
jgi:hypothetical protein